jgi:voltage-gated potassium channel
MAVEALSKTNDEPGRLTAAQRENIARSFEKPALAAAALVIPTLIIEQLNPDSTWSNIASVLNWMIWLVFALEAVVLFSIATSKRRWIRAHILELAIVILSPPIMPPGLQSTRVLRLIRLVRIVRLARIATLARSLFSLKGMYWAAFLSFIIVIGGGAAFTIVEKSQNLTSWDGIYWLSRQ